jgi:hypothetical protein
LSTIPQCEGVDYTSLQEITTFFTKNFGPKNPPYGFFAPMSNLTKVPLWTNHFGFDHFDCIFG